MKDPQCRNWYNETFLEGLNVPSQRPVGVPVNTEGRKRVAVRRKRPKPIVREQVSSETIARRDLERKKGFIFRFQSASPRAFQQALDRVRIRDCPSGHNQLLYAGQILEAG